MVQRRYPFSLGAVLLMASLASVYAAEPLALQHHEFSELKQKFQIQPSSVLMASRPNKNNLRLISQRKDRKKISHIRLQQTYAGFPVFGGYTILHTNKSPDQLWASNNTHSVAMTGLVYDGLYADLGDPDVSFVSRSQEALEAFKAKYTNQSLSEAKVTPMVYVDENHQAHWAYQVSVVVTAEQKVPERPTAIVDAKTFLPFVSWNDMKTAKSAVKASGFGGNQITAPYQYGVEYPLLDISRNDNTGVCYMENSHVKVIDMMHRYEGRNGAMHFVCNEARRQADLSYMTGYKSDGYDRVNGAFSPTNDALYIGGVIHNMYQDWYGFNALEENGKAKQLLMRVHYGFRFENAFWDGRQMTFGDGALSFYPLVSLGVGAHEISHGFTEQHSNLAYFGQSGGMNESFSDMAAQAAEFYSTGSNSWKIGAEIVKRDSGIEALRYMDKPSRDGVSIDSADQYTTEMDVHHTSGVYNRLFYLLSTQPNWTVRKAFEVMVTANADYWTPTSTFEEGACGIMNAAKSFDYSLDDIKVVLKQVGIDYAGCFDESVSSSVTSIK